MVKVLTGSNNSTKEGRVIVTHGMGAEDVLQERQHRTRGILEWSLKMLTGVLQVIKGVAARAFMGRKKKVSKDTGLCCIQRTHGWGRRGHSKTRQEGKGRDAMTRSLDSSSL